MADTEALLAAEIDRVTVSPYPTQLKSLRDLVCQECSEADVNRYVATSSCQVDRLALCLLEGLRRWPYVLDIIAKLAHNVEVRDALLKNEPTLLHNLITQATKTQDVRSKYSTAAVAMLSEPLLETCSLPSETQTLFLRLVDTASGRPSVADVKPVFLLMKSTSTLLLSLLSGDMLRRFEEQIFHILRESTTRTSQEPIDQALTLYCLAIMKYVARASENQLFLTNSFYHTQELLASTQPPSPKWNAAEMEKFFSGPNNVPKTLRLIVMQVMLACSSQSESAQVRLEALALASDLITAIPAQLRDSWCAENTSVVQKLQQKVLSCQSDAVLRMQAFAFVAQLCKPVYLPVLFIGSIRSAISLPSLITQAYHCDSGKAWTQCAMGLINSDIIIITLQGILETIAQADPYKLLLSAEALKHVLRILASWCHDRPEIAEAAFEVLRERRFIQQLQALEKEIPRPIHKPVRMPAEREVCAAAWRRARDSTVHEMSTLLLKCILCRHDPGGVVSSTTSYVLLDLHTRLAPRYEGCQCLWTPRTDAPSVVHFAEYEGTPDDDPTDWRVALREHLASKAEVKHSALSKIFAQACQDLEKRCEDVEAPLRAEQDRYTTLQEQYAQLEEAYAILEGQGIDHELQCDSLSAEKDQLAEELDNAQLGVERLNDRINQLDHTQQACKSNHERSLLELQSARDASDLQHATMLAKKEEEVEDLRQQVQGLHEGRDDKVNELEKLKMDRQQDNTSAQELRTDAERLSTELNESKAVVSRLEQSLREAVAQRGCLESNIESLRKAASEERHAHEQHLQRERDHAKHNTEAANASHNDVMDRMAVKHGEEVSTLERRLSDLHEQLRMLHEQNTAELAKCDDDIHDAHKQVDRLQRRCKQKDQQIEEANKMRQNLMAAIGLQPSLPHRTRSSKANESQIEPSPPTPSSAVGLDDHAFYGRTSFASNASSTHSRAGPTPKRAKPRKSYKAPSPAKPRLSMSVRAARASASGRATTNARRPLESISGNKTPSKRASRTPGKGGLAMNEDFDDSTFDENDLFGRTPWVPTGLEGMPGDDTEI